MDFPDVNGVIRQVSPLNGLPVSSLGQVYTKEITFDGTAGKGASGDVIPLFTPTGNSRVKILGVAEVTPVSAGGGTIRIGNTNLDTMYADSITATTLLIDKFWHDAVAVGYAIDFSTLVERSALNGEAINLKVGVANITAGKIKFYCYAIPLDTNATLA